MKPSATPGHAKKRMARHKIRFAITRTTSDLHNAITEVQVIIRARNGWSTKAIARELHLTPHQVAYRITKGLAIGARADFRAGNWVAECALEATADKIIQEVANKVSVKYL